MLTLVSIVKKEDRMENKILIFIILASSSLIHAKNIIFIPQDDYYTFSMVSYHKKNPVVVHKQNEHYLKVSCKPTDSLNDLYVHSCTVKPKSRAPEGTFALFKRTLKKKLKFLFHISIQR